MKVEWQLSFLSANEIILMEQYNVLQLKQNENFDKSFELQSCRLEILDTQNSEWFETLTLISDTGMCVVKCLS